MFIASPEAFLVIADERYLLKGFVVAIRFFLCTDCIVLCARMTLWGRLGVAFDINLMCQSLLIGSAASLSDIASIVTFLIVF